MKEQELRKHTTCNLCNRKIGEAGLPLFWTVKLTRYALDLHAIQRQHGLAMMMGGSASLANVMGPDEDLATKFSEVELTVCEDCCTGVNMPIAFLAEKGTEQIEGMESEEGSEGEE